jgi:alpha-tubulin suppressor-like RCC1 family protein
MVSAGVSHTCELQQGGLVKCWGFNGFGELGNGTTTNSTTPVPVTGMPAAASIAAGSFHTCAIDTTGAAWCWGSGHFGAIGDGKNANRVKPQAVSGNLLFSQLSLGGIQLSGGSGDPGDFTCGVTQSRGNVYCWGENSDGQLGNGNTTNSNVPVLVTGLPSPAIQVAAGGLHACAVLQGGSVYCWGENNDGQLGNGKLKTSDSPVQATIGGATSVGAGTFASCALVSGGTMMCWGHNADGELGNGSTTNSKVPVAVTGLAGTVQQIAVGGYHTCALVQATGVEEVECWGEPTDGALGDGHFSEPAVTEPEPVLGMQGSAAGGGGVIPVQVATGQQHTCAVISTGQIYCWGFNGKGQVGDGTTQDRTLPTLVIGVTTGIQGIAAGGLEGCALNAALGLECWGADDGNDFNLHDSAQQVSSFTSGAAQLAAGDSDVCVTTSSDTLECWGSNDYGEVGNETTTPEPTPVVVFKLSSPVGSVTEGSNVTCATTSAKKQLFCWGYGGEGSLGNGKTDNEDVPVKVGVLSIQESATDGHSCAISTNAKTFCWGDNHYGQLGDGTKKDSDDPVQVKGLPATAAQIAVGGAFNGGSDLGDFSCALLVTGEVDCWGYGEQGALGDGSFSNSTAPVKVKLSGPAKQVVTGGYSACALLVSGGVQCWGSDAFGNLGDGGNSDQDSPVNVSGLAGILQISTAGASNTTCSLDSSGNVKCWGDNSSDQLGDGTSGGDSNTPQPVTGL